MQICEPAPRAVTGFPSHETEQPLSRAQRRLWLASGAEIGSALHNRIVGLRLRGPLDPSCFERALNELLCRHEPLRTSFPTRDGELIQVVHGALTLALAPGIDISSTRRVYRETRLHELIAAQVGQPFDLARGPLVSAMLYKLAHEEHVFVLVAHALVWDDWSVEVFLRELDGLYGALVCAGSSKPRAAELRYRDFVHWQGEDAQGSPSATSARGVGTGARESMLLPLTALEAARALAELAQASLQQILLGSWAVMLAHLTECDEVTIGLRQRGREMPGSELLIGSFETTAALRCDLSASPSFHQLLSQLRQSETEGLGRACPPLHASFVQRGSSARPRKLANLDCAPLRLPPSLGTHELALVVEEAGHGSICSLEYPVDRLDRETAGALLRRFKRSLIALCEAPSSPVTALQLLQ